MMFRVFLIFVVFAGSAAAIFGSSVQEQAEFLAGITLPRNTLLSPLQNSTDYREHQKELQDQWAFCRRIRYDAMRQWGRDHLSQNVSTRGVVRYLFGGPDFLNAHAFFPDARIMVLGGLEPVGEMPSPETLTPESFAAGLKSLREALHTSLFCGYFITSEMRPQLLQGSFRGVLPVLLTELALTGNHIISVEMTKPFGSPGLKILYEHFDPRAETQPQILYYFQADLSNGSEGHRFLGWLGDLGHGASYLKAASYLLPLDSFSEARNFLLNTSALILQDDSGIPFHDFHSEQWKVHLFGVYTEPLPIFKLRKEAELEAAYLSTDYAGPLSFGAGYHVNAYDANLMLATRRDGQVDLEVLPSALTPTLSPTPSPVPTRTPKPKRIRTLKGLPVEVRKALPVEIRKALPVDASLPVPMSQSPVGLIPL